MKKRIRSAALILTHIGLILSVLYLVFCLICTVRSQNAAESSNEKDRYLSQAISDYDFSVYTVGRALSDSSDPARENLFIFADLIIPVLFLISGILLQIALIRKRHKHPALPQQKPSQAINHRR